MAKKEKEAPRREKKKKKEAKEPRTAIATSITMVNSNRWSGVH